MSRWPSVALGELISQDLTYISQPEPKIYPKLSVKLYGRGVELDTPADGTQVKMSKHQLAKPGQIILSEIWAKKGAIGIVPESGNGALCTSHFFLFDIDDKKIKPGYMSWLLKGNYFEPQLSSDAKGTTGYAAVRPKHFLAATIPLPTLTEQQTIVAHLNQLAEKVRQVNEHLDAAEADAANLLAVQFREAIKNAPLRKMSEVAPLVRREQSIELEGSYPELGIRSFGKGTFHKPPLSGSEVGTKRLFRIEPGDLMFSNVFAWEGAIAIAQPEDSGRFGSHRFITCKANPEISTAEFLRYFFLTDTGLEMIGKASPGGAGRNRTLGLEKLMALEVPVPSLAIQREFNLLQTKIAELKVKHAKIREANQALIPATLERLFSNATGDRKTKCN